jgi:hypothetical protein
MDGLEDEEPFFTEEELEKILQEEPTEEEIQENFSTITPNPENIFQDDDYLTEAIREFNQQSIEDGDWSPELEEQYWEQAVYPKELERIKSVFDWNKYPDKFKENWYDFIDAEFSGEVTLVGHDVGALAAYGAATLVPHRVRAVLGMSVGEKKSSTFPPEDGYGKPRAEMM